MDAYICVLQKKKGTKTKHDIAQAANTTIVLLKFAHFELQIPANDRDMPGDFDSGAEMSVRVRKGGFMVETLRHQNDGPNVIFKLWSYKSL